ncbi:hypothetical protein PVK06_007616 [Gossypium arboreum]|uniref:RIN4 pathogenic type III effector avirulence factor Avr cleavage site domain-containing protein n=1 Tax=Gossypium arboreum TaxID=29729 RepID=A0ABR0QHT1_GOSAR|nr:hypothetical protein PVK06_007616 [Gossypium arboreum]
MSSYGKGQALPKFGEWDVNDPASAEGYTAIFNIARDEKRTGGNVTVVATEGIKSQQKQGTRKGKRRHKYCIKVKTHKFKDYLGFHFYKNSPHY